MDEKEFTFNLELNTKFEIKAESESDAWDAAEDFSSNLITEIEEATDMGFVAEWTIE